MPPMNDPDLMGLDYSIKLLAKTIDEVDSNLHIAINKIEDLQEKYVEFQKLAATIDNKLEILPLVLAGKLEGLIEKRTSEAFEDLRVTMDELRNKLWAIKRDMKSVKDQTGSHLLPPRDHHKKEEDGDGLTIRKGKFQMKLPFGEGTWKVIRYVAISLVGLLATGATAGGIWALIERLLGKH